jgi:putative PEP-CTERM system histidine kinase
MTMEALLAFGSAGLGTVLAIGAAFKAGRSPNRWAFAIGMAALSAERCVTGLMASAPSPNAAYHWQIWRLVILGVLPGLWLLFSLTYARGNAREFLRKWRYALGAAFLFPSLVGFLFRTRLIASTELIEGSRALIFRLSAYGGLLYLLVLVAAILVLVNLEHTFRSAVGTVRWRIKFILLGVGVLFLVRLFTTSQALLFGTIDPRLDILHSGALLVAGLLILRSLFRTGHFNMDVHPSHSVLQGSVTILLVGVYLLLVGVLAKVVTYLGGDSSFAAKALVVLVLLVLLAVFLQSDRVRLHLSRFVSRHFQRPLHDYRTVWRKFTEGTASRVEQTDYCRAVVKLVADIFQSLSVTIWIVGDRREKITLGASTGLSERQALELQPNPAETLAVLEQLSNHPEPVDIENITAEWASVLRRCHPDEFHKGGTRACVPITAGGEVLAFLLLGDRVSGAAFALQDFDLLKSIGDQVASGLLNVRLSQRLLQAREHEAFQTMATFFVHDLKNAASTLNLMLQNLPDHFDDPAFREDALRGVGKSVAHINHLISRLGQLRSELKIAPADADLNEVVRNALTAFATEKEFQIETQLGAMPRLLLDREQFGKVVTNLVLNAREASVGPGRLRLTTSRAGAWAVLEAADNGSGISPEFLARSLFRPFQTTKKNGLGIGMFQSKMIVEAHGGRITVESVPGNGTTFRIFLPLTSLS